MKCTPICKCYTFVTQLSRQGSYQSGLLGDAFPTRLVDIEFSITNLQHLPTNLHEIWTFVQYFVLEGSLSITEIPETLVKLKIPQLLLRSNNIASIPDDLLVDQAFTTLQLDGNPLLTLPQHIGAIEQLYKLGVSSTMIADLPLWMTEPQYDVYGDLKPSPDYVEVVAGGSPLCQDANQAIRTSVMSFFVWNCEPAVSRYA